MEYVLAQFRADLENKLKLQKKLEQQYHAEQCLIKKLAIVNSLSFDTVLPKDLLTEVFEYMGDDNMRIAKAIAVRHVSRPNISTAKNCKMFVEQLSCNSGSLKQFLVLFRKHHPDDQEQVLNLLSVSDIIRLFHVPNRMKRRVSECLTGIVKSFKIEKKSRTKATAPFMMQDPTYARPVQPDAKVSEDVRTKLQKFDDTLVEYKRIVKNNRKEDRRRSGADKVNDDSKYLILLNFMF